MTTHRRETRNSLEQLLDGNARPGQLDELIRAARAPGLPHETSGLDAAVAAFCTAPPLLVSAPSTMPGTDDRSPSMLKRLSRRAAAVNALAAAASAVAVGGIALASASLSNAPSHTARAAATASDHPQHPASARPTGSDIDQDSNSPHPSSTPSPSLVGLCTAWLARPHASGQADSSAAFTVLVTAAGGAGAVEGYCTALLATRTHPGGGPTERHPPTLPTQASSHPNAKPAEVPPVPTPSHPTGRP